MYSVLYWLSTSILCVSLQRFNIGLLTVLEVSPKTVSISTVPWEMTLYSFSLTEKGFVRSYNGGRWGWGGWSYNEEGPVRNCNGEGPGKSTFFNSPITKIVTKVAVIRKFDDVAQILQN